MEVPFPAEHYKEGLGCLAPEQKFRRNLTLCGYGVVTCTPSQYLRTQPTPAQRHVASWLPLKWGIDDKLSSSPVSGRKAEGSWRLHLTHVALSPASITPVRLHHRPTATCVD